MQIWLIIFLIIPEKNAVISSKSKVSTQIPLLLKIKKNILMFFLLAKIN